VCWLAGRVLLKIVYLLMRCLLSLAVLVVRANQARYAELLVLRHENAVLRRHTGRVRYEPADRAWLAALARLIPRGRWAGIFPVTPATLLAWHRKLTRKKYDTSRRRKPGRPPTARSIARLAARSGDHQRDVRQAPELAPAGLVAFLRVGGYLRGWSSCRTCPETMGNGVRPLPGVRCRLAHLARTFGVTIRRPCCQSSD
jgi:hypothetical protein